MPNIVQYEAKGELTPSDKGIQAAEVAGRRLGTFGQQIKGDLDQFGQQVEEHMAVMETSELYKTGTELRLNLQTKYDQESGLPENRSDPHFGDRFMAEVGPTLDQWGAGVNTRKGKELAAVMKGNIRNDIFNHVAAGQSEMDAAHVHDNLNQTINTLSAGLQLDPSEANLNRTLDTARTAIQGMTSAIPDVKTREEVATQLTNERLPQIVTSRYQSVFESVKQQVGATGDETKSAAYDQAGKDIAAQVGFQYLPPEVQARLSGARDEAVRQGMELYKAHDAVQRKADGDAFDAEITRIETSMYKSNGAGGVTMTVTPEMLDAAQRAARMPGAKQFPGRVESLFNAMHVATQDQIDGKERTTDRSTYLSLANRIGSTTNPLTKSEVDDQRLKLSNDDYKFLREGASDSKLANPKINHAITELHRWEEQIKPMIDKSDPLGGSIDQQGAEKFSYFAWDAEEAFRKAIAGGAEPDAAVQSLTDPHNPRGLYHFIPNYQTTNKQGLAGVLAATRPGGVVQTAPVPGGVRADHSPAQPGESPAAYLKRTQ